MRVYTSLLIPLDGSLCGEKAAQVGLSLAAQLDLQVRLLYVLDNDVQVEPGPAELVSALSLVREAARTRGQGILDRAVELAHRLGVEVKTRLESGWPEEVILQQAKDCDLVVMGTHGRGGLERCIMGSVAQAVIARSLKPVLVVNERYNPPPSPEENIFRRLLIATDGSEWSSRAVQHGVRLASSLGAEVSLLHVVELPHKLAGQKTVGLPEHELLGQGQAVLEEALKLAAETGLAAQPILMQGHPVESILQASQQHDLVVMGTRGRSGLDRLLLGSITERVARLSAKPVLVIPGGFTQGAS
ncbi:universal stress protein [Meiothermus cerbereus]|uniref:universal stress protein n=1 Tax=Meiothermus cerbereus TaxID=65552 RepID=UPI0006876398|nr:universal stress protein [Meiothermus cerbereus]